MIDWLIDWLIHWLVDSLIDWLIDWLIEWVSEWVIDWLIDWLIDVIRLTEPDRCHSLPCQNGGTCIQEITGTYKCQCQEGFRGFNCEGQWLTTHMLVRSRLSLDSFFLLEIFFSLKSDDIRRLFLHDRTQFYNNSWSTYFIKWDRFTIVLMYDDGKIYLLVQSSCRADYKMPINIMFKTLQ